MRIIGLKLNKIVRVFYISVYSVDLKSLSEA